MIRTVMQLQRNVIVKSVVGQRFLIVTWFTCNVFMIDTRPHPCRFSDGFAGLRVAYSRSHLERHPDCYAVSPGASS